jgi:ketose-bisphosphate aldolase
MIRAVIDAAEALEQPVIMQLGVVSLKDGGEALIAAALAAGRAARVPVALHLDHCTDLKLIERCFQFGVSSALADGARLSFAENVAFVRQAVTCASRYGAAIEAELGYLIGTEDGVSVEAVEASLTDPLQAREFLELTGAHLLAIAIGNVHGYTPNPPDLDFGRLAQIAGKVNALLVLHGASGLARTEIQRAIRGGIVKVNVNTEVRTAFLWAMTKWATRIGPEPDLRRKGQDLLDLLQAGTDAARTTVREMIKTCAFVE